MTMRLPVLPSKNRFISSCDILCLVFLTMVLLLPADALYASANCTFHHTHLHEHEAHPETKNITEVTDQHHPTAMYPQELGNPLDPPLILAGTFGELRSNHFHGGLDIKTGGVENWKIYSIADGYVSRIKVSSGGYGKAIYVTHPNGYTSVYAHVNGFFPELDEYIQNQQYARQSFYFDDAIPADLFPVKKGQVIAKSGNTGSSTAPHLHFEIRDTFSEAALNPLLFGYQVADTRLPLIEQLGVYPILDFNKKGTPKTYDVKKVNGKYALANGQNLLQLPYYQVGLGLKAYDKQNAANNLNGIYSLKVF
ncbi:MAG: M23 family metallopeptidase, partial [Chitinophagales bacterium]